MFGLFKRRPRVNVAPDTRVPAFFTTGYVRQWEQQPMPSPGALSWSWETLQLPPYTPIGTGTVPTRLAWNTIYSPPLYVGQGVPVAGIPTTAGQIITAPLLNP